jgi:hypothetical protein
MAVGSHWPIDEKQRDLAGGLRGHGQAALSQE